MYVLQSTAPAGFDHQDITQSSFGDSAAISKFKEHISEPHDPRIDQENIDSIEDKYYICEDEFDPSEYELKVRKHYFNNCLCSAKKLVIVVAEIIMNSCRFCLRNMQLLIE